MKCTLKDCPVHPPGHAIEDHAPIVEPMPPITKQVDVGDCVLRITIDGAGIDDFIRRIERAIGAFKEEWERDKKDL